MLYLCSDFDSQLTATWLAAIGTVLAASVAVGIAFWTSQQSKKAERTRQDILMASLRPGLLAAARSCLTSAHRVKEWGELMEPKPVREVLPLIHPPATDSLKELRAHLLGVNDERAILLSEFLAELDSYDTQHKVWSADIEDLEGVGSVWLCKVLHYAHLRRLAELAIALAPELEEFKEVLNGKIVADASHPFAIE